MTNTNPIARLTASNGYTFVGTVKKLKEATSFLEEFELYIEDYKNPEPGEEEDMLESIECVTDFFEKNRFAHIGWIGLSDTDDDA
jgi:hypothetical protein